MAIMLLAIGAILMIQSTSVESSIKARELNTVAMLARSKLIEIELELEGRPINEAKKEDGGTFAPPHDGFRWSRKVQEIQFPPLGAGGGDKTDIGARISRLMTQHINKSVREVVLTVSWKRGKGEATRSFSTYLVDLNREFQLSE